MSIGKCLPAACGARRANKGFAPTQRGRRPRLRLIQVATALCAAVSVATALGGRTDYSPGLQGIVYDCPRMTKQEVCTVLADQANRREVKQGDARVAPEFQPVGKTALLLPLSNTRQLAESEQAPVNWPAIDVVIDGWREGGFSVFLDGRRGPVAAETYYVSLKGHARIFKEPPTDTELMAYVTDNLESLKRPGHFLGGWRGNGRYYLDVTVPVHGKNRALEIAAENDQDAIWDAFAGQPIQVAEVVVSTV
jgi:hypothetical protein